MDAPTVDRLVQRQGLGLGGVVGGVVEGIGGVVDGVGSVVSGVVGGVTSAVGGLGGALTASQTSSSSSPALSTSSTSSRILPSTSSTSARSSSSTISTSTSSSSSSSSSSSASSSVLSSSTISSASRSSSSSVLTTTTALPPTTTDLPLVIETVTSNGVPRTVIVSQAVDAPVETNPVAPAAPKGFLENKGLSGFVFALCGLVGLVLIIAIVTFIIRRKRSKALMSEAIDFDPSAATTYRDDMERALSSEKRNSSSSSAGSYRGNGSQVSHGSYNQQPMVPQGPSAYYDTGYAQPMNYNPQHGYAEYPTYAPPNPAYDVGRPAQHYTDAGQNNAAYNIAYEARGQSPSPPPARSQAPATALPATFGDSYSEKGSVMETVNGAPLKVANHQAY